MATTNDKSLYCYSCLRACSGDDFVVWKKEICSIYLMQECGKETHSKFQRLEFQDIWGDDDVILDWLEPTIWEAEPALIIHCHLLSTEKKKIKNELPTKLCMKPVCPCGYIFKDFVFAGDHTMHNKLCCPTCGRVFDGVVFQTPSRNEFRYDESKYNIYEP